MSTINNSIKEVFQKNPKVSEVYVTSDDNIFHGEAGLRFCKNHCKSAGVKYNTITREQSNEIAESTTAPTGTDTNTAGSEVTPGTTTTPAPVADWKTLKFGEIVEFAAAKGLVVKTKKTDGTKKLIEEVEAFLEVYSATPANVPATPGAKGAGNESAGEGTEGEGEDSQYTPVTDHKSQD
jgi:hypothetical protein